MIRRFIPAVVIIGLVSTALAVEPGPASDGPVKIGMLKTMFRDVRPSVFAAMSKPFHTVMVAQTGLKGELVLVDSAEAMQQQLANGELQLGAFHGFEFAWMKLKDPTLQPLMLAGAPANCLKVAVVVAKDCSCNNFDGLTGKSLAMPVGTREHSRLFVARQCRRSGRSVQDYFKETVMPPSVEEALDDVVDGKTNATVVEVASLQMYERRKPGRFNRLRVISTSDDFPPGVIAYREGGLGPTEQKKFRDGMATAHKSLLGSQMMSLMKISAFETVPGNFDQMLAQSIKSFPPPWVNPR